MLELFKEVSMKKGFLLSLLLAVVVLSTGCASKEAKLVCKQTASGVDVTFNVDFAGKVIKNMDFSYDMDLSKYSDAQIEAIGKQDFCSRVKSSMSTFKDAFSNCNQEISSKHLNVKAELDVNKVAKDYVSKIAKPESAKAELEKVGYTCTIQR